MTGTSYFYNLKKAEQYYAQYEPEYACSECGGITDELRSLVREKVREGEIHIGKPDLPWARGRELSLDEDGRWHVADR